MKLKKQKLKKREEKIRIKFDRKKLEDEIVKKKSSILKTI
jgi:hypothetical protein